MSTLLGKYDAPAVQRARQPGWRDPRLWVGVAIVAVSVLLGARLLGSADETLAVWAAGVDLAPGDQVGAADVVVQRVQFAEPSDANRYWPADEPVPADARLVREVSAGELLPRSALGGPDDSGLQELPLDFDSKGAAVSLDRGDVVDVWVLSEGSDARSRLILQDVVVLRVDHGDGGFGSSASRQVVLGVPTDSDELAVVVEAAFGDRVYLVEQG